MPVQTASSNHDKTELRARLRSARWDRTPTEVAQADEQRSARLARRLRRLAPAVVAAYSSGPDEPDTTVALLDLIGQGTTVLLPARLPGRPDQPAWLVWSGDTAPPAWSARPTSTVTDAVAGPVADATELARADVIWLPGLAGTAAGDRLGRGGGWYDRALLYARPGVPRWLLLWDDEVLPTLPIEDHDQTVTALVTERRWIDCSPMSDRRSGVGRAGQAVAGAGAAPPTLPGRG